MAMGSAPLYPAAARPGYEFSEAENARIDVAAKYARWWGGISIASGVLLVLMGGGLLLVASTAGLLPSGTPGKAGIAITLGAIAVAVLPVGAVYFACGFFYLGAGADLKKVITTEGQDMPLFIHAMRSMGRAFMVEAIATVAGLVLGAILGVVAVAAGKP